MPTAPTRGPQTWWAKMAEVSVAATVMGAAAAMVVVEREVAAIGVAMTVEAARGRAA